MRMDIWFRRLMFFFSLIVCLIFVSVLLALLLGSIPSIHKFGFGFLFSNSWNPVKERFGALPFIYGSVMTSVIAMLISVPIGIGIAVFLTEKIPLMIRTFLLFLIELLAAIPSVVYGLIGIFFLVPFVRNVVNPLFDAYLGWIPFLSGTYNGLGIFTAGLILSIMILPFITNVSVDAFQSVPIEQKEAALALGLTKWDVFKEVTLSYAQSGVACGIFLALGRAFGETMAVAMVIGNSHRIAQSLFAPGYTIPSVIANEFAEATSDLYIGVLSEMGLILLTLSVIISISSRIIIRHYSRYSIKN